jgi:pyruvate dehydrogenase E2 component (dihydrolipoamide acetyltransferase)/2-oxoisovalerate dehydrogenase E2 component (dihydrolipoyl transacylase)
MDWRLPELGEGVYEAEMVRWLVEPGTAVKRGQSLLEVMTDKATMEVPAPFAGTVTHLAAEPGQTLKVGDVVLRYDGGDGEPASSVKVAAKRSGNGPVAGFQRRLHLLIWRFASRHRRRSEMARKLGVDLNRIRGSPRLARVLLDDLTDSVPTPESWPAAEPTERPLDFGRPATRIKVVGLRRRMPST